MSQVRIVFSTVSNTDQALQLARSLIAERLAACVNIVPAVTSLYQWEGRVQEETEQLLIFKTTASRVEELIQHLAEGHPYDLPEVVALPVTDGLAGYLDWVTSETEPGKGDR